MTRDMDTRRLDFQTIEVRESDDGAVTIRGHAAVFNSLSEPIAGVFRERIAPGAFKRSLGDGGDVFALWQHDSSLPLARRSNGSLRLTEDSRGLAVEIDLPDTSYGRDAREAVGSGLVDKMSFGFSVPAGGDRMTDERSSDNLPIRELTDVDLYEVSPVTFPAYSDTELSARSRDVADEIASATESEDDGGVDALSVMRLKLDLHDKTA